ncbi:MAG: hypothetical protein Q9227_005082 [Pyrenula ochraceoflavens]
MSVFSQTQHHPIAAREAASGYHDLLQLAQHRVARLGTGDLNERDVDACLLTTTLMGRYETAIYRSNTRDPRALFQYLPAWSHHDGAMAILKCWNDRLDRKNVTAVIKSCRRGLIRSYLLRNLALPGWMLDGSRFGEEGSDLEIDNIIVRTTNLRHALSGLQDKAFPDLIHVTNLHKEVQLLDKALQEWASRIPSVCSFQEHALAEPGCYPKQHLYSPKVFEFSELGDASVWAYYFSAGILIYSTHLKILKHVNNYPYYDMAYGDLEVQCVQQLNRLAESLASTIPFCLKRLKGTASDASHSLTLDRHQKVEPYLASLVIWPLSIASNMGEGIYPHLYKWFRAELSSLGRLVGDGALQCADTNDCASRNECQPRTHDE